MATTDTSIAHASADATPRRRYMPLPLTSVTLQDAFWAPRQRTNRERTLDHIHEQCKITGRIDALSPDWQPSDEVIERGPWGGTPTMFWDSDIAKWLEAISYELATHPDPRLDALMDEIIALLDKRQLADGYLNTWFTTVDPANRFKNLRDWHELYNAGHLIEAAVAHYEATGKRSFLDIMARYVDLIDATFGREEGKLRGYCGHPEIEMALVRMYHATGERRYLELSRYFVNERGQQPPHYYVQEALARGEDPSRFWARSFEYNQSHLPVREQERVVGHAVRAAYLYSAMADLAAEDGDASLLAACERLWQHLTTREMYVMGGIGTSRQNEGFTGDYDLPNESAYAETCAAIALVFWAQRMLAIDCNRRYSDVMELALYNAVLSGGSEDGTHFFYDNPLASNGTHHRSEWFVCPCCPPNLARLFASLGSYIYAASDHEAAVHLYVQGSAKLTLAEHEVTLRQETNYPWDGAIKLHVNVAQPTTFGLRLRIPAWCRAPRLSVNGETVDLSELDRGYAVIKRTWQDGDVVALDLPMTVERIYAHPAVRADVGSVALQRGPIIFCLEQTDNAAPLHTLSLPKDAELNAHLAADLLGGVVVIDADGSSLADADWSDTLYRTTPPATQPAHIRAIPYYAWDHREPGAMTVWIREG